MKNWFKHLTDVTLMVLLLMLVVVGIAMSLVVPLAAVKYLFGN